MVAPGAAPGERNALLVLGGWASAADSLADTSRRPLRQQPIRSDGTWLAPWLLTPQVVDSTSGAVVALDFDIRDDAAQRYSQTLATIFPGQSPTASGFRAWRAGRGDPVAPLTLYAASRAAYMPARPGHEGHESEVAWFPGGTVTPVGLPPSHGPEKGTPCPPPNAARGLPSGTAGSRRPRPPRRRRRRPSCWSAPASPCCSAPSSSAAPARCPACST